MAKKDTHYTHFLIMTEPFSKIKQLLTSNTVMVYFNQQKQTELITDASPVGLSATLFRKTPGKRVVASTNLYNQDLMKYTYMFHVHVIALFSI